MFQFNATILLNGKHITMLSNCGCADVHIVCIDLATGTEKRANIYNDDVRQFLFYMFQDREIAFSFLETILK